MELKFNSNKSKVLVVGKHIDKSTWGIHILKKQMNTNTLGYISLVLLNPHNILATTLRIL